MGALCCGIRSKNEMDEEEYDSTGNKGLATRKEGA